MSPGESLGAAFTVRLPLTASHRPSDPGRRHPLVSGAVTPEFHSTDLSGVRILVVDDRADARELIRRVLSECNAELLASGSAEEALVLIEKTPEIDDACLEGELAGGKKGRGSRNKVPIVAAVQTTPGGHPIVACLRQQPHTAEEVSVFAAAHIATSATVDSNGLWCFRATAIVGADHQHIVTSGGQATVKLPRFKAVNALLGNLRTATTGNYQAFDFAKYAHRYLAEFQHRFNRRFNMKSILPRLLVALIGAPPASERVLRAAEVSRFQVSSRATVDEDRFVAKLDPSCQHRPFLAAQRFRPVRAVRQF